MYKCGAFIRLLAVLLHPLSSVGGVSRSREQKDAFADTEEGRKEGERGAELSD